MRAQCDESDADKSAEVSWLRQNVMGRIKQYGQSASRPEIVTRIDAGLGGERLAQTADML